MIIRWARGICIALAIAAVTAGISFQLLNNKKSEKLNAVFVSAIAD